MNTDGHLQEARSKFAVVAPDPQPITKLAPVDTCDNPLVLITGPVVDHHRFREPTVAGAGDDSISSGGGDDTISGLDGNDTIMGGGGNDTLYGDAGNDSLVGQAGLDSMVGGTGDDIFVVNDAGDTTVELQAEGIDTVKTSLSSYVLPENIEKLTETANVDAYLTGNGMANTIKGNAGNDTLDGGRANDTLFGGSGNDLYIVNTADTIKEKPDGGIDTVQLLDTAGGYIVYYAPPNVENVTVGTSGKYNLYGNSLDNVLIGNDNFSAIDGGAGSDTMVGGNDSNNYFVQDTGDVVIDTGHRGVDVVLTTVSYTIPTNIEYLFAEDQAGTHNLILIGNPGANSIGGNDGKNRIDGAGGSDVVTGFGGADTFVLHLGGTFEFVEITDFDHKVDHLELDHVAFGFANTGALDPGAFKIVGTGGTVDSTDRIIYDQSTGQVFFDADGSGKIARILIAQLDGAPVLDSHDFVLT